MVQFIRELEPSSRPRERLLDFGPSALSDAELLAVLLRTGRRGRGAVVEANALLVAAGGLPELARWEAAELLAVDGIGPAKAATILASLELGHRIARSHLRESEILGDPEVVGEYLVRRLQVERREVFGFLTVDGRHRLIRSHEHSLGTRTQAPVDPGEVFRKALHDGAAAVLLYHNHPSGQIEPSRDDLELTRRLVRGGEVLGVAVHDHVIVGSGRWLSLRRSRPGLFG
ncbi:MAG TPA: DNA repair protein RadC [Candidatus Sulfomarinibacteraceae bacterium]|nr:DNA repair protein RadC [Candidatus Sulfomarinibacteraceae bacterium]